MKALRLILIVLLAAVAATLVSSCRKQEKSPGANKAAAAAPARKTLEQALAGVPCKLENKAGIFAAFPNNPSAGQKCFSLTPESGGKGADIPPFDIKDNTALIIVHESHAVKPETIRLMNWGMRGGAPCTEKDCGEPVPVKSESYADEKKPGWIYIVLTPEKPLGLTGGSVYGVAVQQPDKLEKYLPLFE